MIESLDNGKTLAASRSIDVPVVSCHSMPSKHTHTATHQDFCIFHFASDVDCALPIITQYLSCAKQHQVTYVSWTAERAGSSWCLCCALAVGGASALLCWLG